jgi:hypothetical protein
MRAGATFAVVYGVVYGLTLHVLVAGMVAGVLLGLLWLSLILLWRPESSQLTTLPWRTGRPGGWPRLKNCISAGLWSLT